jgi:hypothetical protein
MSTIGSFFDLLDAGVDAFERLADAPPSRGPRRAPQARPADAGRRRPASTPSSSVALAARRVGGFRVVESTDADTGRASHVVTDGRDRAECSSAEFAARVRDALG